MLRFGPYSMGGGAFWSILTMRKILAIAVLSVLAHPAFAQQNIERDYGFDYPGGDYRDIRSITLDQCQYICRRDGRCVAFSYVPSKRWCWLKDEMMSSVHDGRTI